MHLIFFDESKNDNEYLTYHIGGVVIEDIRLLEIETQINKIAEDIFGTSRLNQDTEIHACEIFHRTKNFKNWRDFDARVSVLHRIIEILNLSEVELINIQINCDLLSQYQSPEEIGFMYFCERANDLMRIRKGLGMLIGDRENDRSAAKYAGSLSDYKAKGTYFKYGRSINNLVDSVHFTQSHLSRFLQLADVYVWLLQFQNRNRNSTNYRHMAILDFLKQEKINLFPSKYKEWPVRIHDWP